MSQEFLISLLRDFNSEMTRAHTVYQLIWFSKTFIMTPNIQFMHCTGKTLQ